MRASENLLPTPIGFVINFRKPQTLRVERDETH